MGFRVIVCAMVLLGPVAHAQDTVLQPGAPIARDISGGEAHAYSLHLEPGDLLKGGFEISNLVGAVEILDPTRKKVRSFVAYEPSPAQQVPVSFVAQQSGTHQVYARADGDGKGSYTLRLERVTSSERTIDTRTSKVVYTSERLKKIDASRAQGDINAVDHFWSEVADKGPLVEPLPGTDQDVLVTFLWKGSAATKNVLLSWGGGYRPEENYLNHVADTNIWYKTLRIARGSRFTYTLAPNDAADAFGATAQLDPLNLRRQPEEADPTDVNVASVLELPGAVDESWFRRTPTLRGAVEHKTFTSMVQKSPRDIWIYMPPAYTTNAGPYPLVILFDGRAYLDDKWGIGAVNTIDNLINDKRMRPAIVCFVDTSQSRGTDLNYGDVFARVVADELLPMLRSSYPVGADANDIVVGGYSSGGLAGAYIAVKHPGVFGNVLSQSGAFRQRVAGSTEPTTIAQLYLAQKAAPVRFYLDSGLYEPAPSAQSPMHEALLDEGNSAGNRHFRDVLVAKGYDVIYRETGGAHQSLHWRATLADALMTLLKP